jgi:AcrR family transcriptional regulator
MTVSLQERRRRETSAEVSRVAMRLFAERGYDAVTVDEIATAVGISPRTFFRYFASKDDVVLQYRRRLDDRLVAALRAVPARGGAFTALRDAYLETATTAPDERAKWARRSQVLFDTPALGARAHAEQCAKDGALVAALAERMGVDPAVDPRPHLLAVTMVAAAGAAFAAWVADGGRDDPAARLDGCFSLLGGGLGTLDGLGRRRGGPSGRMS